MYSISKEYWRYNTNSGGGQGSNQSGGMGTRATGSESFDLHPIQLNEPESTENILTLYRRRLIANPRYTFSAIIGKSNLVTSSFLIQGSVYSSSICRIVRYFTVDNFLAEINEFKDKISKDNRFSALRKLPYENAKKELQAIFHLPVQIFQNDSDQSRTILDALEDLEKYVRGKNIIEFNPVPIGTGFLVGADYILTCFHVIPGGNSADQCFVQFNHTDHQNIQNSKERMDFELNPKVIFYNKQLDYVLIQIKSSNLMKAPGYQLGWVPLIEMNNNISPGLSHNDLEKIQKEKPTLYKQLEEQKYIQSENTKEKVEKKIRGDNVFIIHHPKGTTQRLSLSDNVVTALNKITVEYEADTDFGSSGAPVFNNSWELVGITNCCKESKSKGKSGENGLQPEVTEGIRIHKIIEDLKRQSIQSPKLQAFIDNYLITSEQLNYAPLPSSLEFDGICNYVMINDIEYCFNSGDFSFEVWVNPLPSETSSTIFSKICQDDQGRSPSAIGDYSLQVYITQECEVVFRREFKLAPELKVMTSLKDYLKEGKEGEEVIVLHKILTNLNIYTGQIKNKFEKDTNEAVVKFQEANFLTQDGIVGKKTREVLNRDSHFIDYGSQVETLESIDSIESVLLERESEGKEVKTIHKILSCLGFYNKKIHDKFDEYTEKAVIEFQKANGLKVNGKIDEKTRKKLILIVGRINRNDKRVEELKSFLQGYLSSYEKNIDEILSNSKNGMERIVKKYQKKKGLTEDGVIGPLTLKAFEEDQQYEVRTEKRVVSFSQFSHIAITYHSTEPQSIMKIYVNGDVEKIGNLSLYLGSLSPCLIGAVSRNLNKYSINTSKPDEVSDFFKGSMAEFRIWNKVCSRGQIISSMYFRLRETDQNEALVCYWRFDEGNGDEIYNLGKVREWWLNTIPSKSLNNGNISKINTVHPHNIRWRLASDYPFLPLSYVLCLNSGEFINFKKQREGQRILNQESLTVEAWVKHLFGNCVFFSLGDDSGRCSLRCEGKKILVDYKRNGENVFQVSTRREHLDDNMWHHIVFTWSFSQDISKGEISIYIDGIKQDLLVIKGKVSSLYIPSNFYKNSLLFKDKISTSDEITVGGSSNEGQSNYYDNFSFCITEVRCWKKALNQEDIKASMYRRLLIKNIRDPKLISYLRLDEGNEEAFDWVSSESYKIKKNQKLWFPVFKEIEKTQKLVSRFIDIKRHWVASFIYKLEALASNKNLYDNKGKTPEEAKVDVTIAKVQGVIDFFSQTAQSDDAGKYSFNPEGNMTRAEYSALILAALPGGETHQNPSFTDSDNLNEIENHKYEEQINNAYRQGLISGNEVQEQDGTKIVRFNPDANITRSEVIETLVDAQRYDLERYSNIDVENLNKIYKEYENDDSSQLSQDLNEPENSQTKIRIIKKILSATKRCVIIAQQDDRESKSDKYVLDLYRDATRAEIAAMIYQSFFYLLRKNTPSKLKLKELEISSRYIVKLPQQKEK